MLLPSDLVICCSQSKKLAWGDLPHSTLELTFPVWLNVVSKNAPSLFQLPRKTSNFLVGSSWALPSALHARTNSKHSTNLGCLSRVSIPFCGTTMAVISDDI